MKAKMIDWSDPAVAELWEAREQDEVYLVRFIKQYLLTPAQKARLAAQDIDIPDILNGRVLETKMVAARVNDMFRDWNARLGHEAFYLDE